MILTEKFYFFPEAFFLVVLFFALAFLEVFFLPPKALLKLDAYFGVEPTRRIVTASFPYDFGLMIKISINEYCMNNGSRQGTEAPACQFSLILALPGLNQFLVSESSWFVRIDPQSFPSLTFVSFIISFAPVHIAITFEG